MVRSSARRIIPIVAIAVSAAVAATSCSSSGSSGAAALGDAEGAAADRGEAFLASRLADIDPLHQSGIDYLRRNWGGEVLAPFGRASVEGIAAILAGAPTEGDTTELRALARLADPSLQQSPVPPETLASRTAAMAAGLYCDAVPIENFELANWDQLTSRGGYDATHVVLAWSWTKELGCTNEQIDAAGERATARVIEEFNQDMGTRPLADAIDDLFLEQGAMLALVGRTDVLTDAWFEAVVESQQPDGGWRFETRVAQPDAPSDWHATFLAVWALHAAGRAPSEPMVLA